MGMNDYIDTREGWREISENDPAKHRDVLVLRIEGRAGARGNRYWVREEPVPPLPTAPGWYRNRRVFGALFLRTDGQWVTGNGVHIKPEDIRDRDLEPLEPPAMTAKAVLDRVRATGLWQIVTLANPANGRELDDIARDFGVVSA